MEITLAIAIVNALYHLSINGTNEEEIYTH